MFLLPPQIFTAESAKSAEKDKRKNLLSFRLLSFSALLALSAVK